MSAVSSSDARLRALLEAGLALASELSLDALLHRLVEAAAEITAARYAALGVIDPSGSQLERFLTVGIEPEEQAAIGDPPRGRGILGVLIRDAKPLRLARSHRGSAVGRLPAASPADALVPRGAGAVARGGLREPVSDGEGRWGGLHRGGRGARHRACRSGCGRDRERAALRSRDRLVASARVVDRGRKRRRHRDRHRALARPRRPPPPRSSSTRGSSASRCRTGPTGSGSSPRRARGARNWSGRRSCARRRRADGFSIAAGASASIRCSTTRRWTAT